MTGWSNADSTAIIDLTVMLKPGAAPSVGLPRPVPPGRRLASADVIVLDDSFRPLNWVALRQGVRIIQLWHASGAFKTVGYSRVGKPGDLNPFAGPTRTTRPRS